MEKDGKDRPRAFATKPMMDITDKTKTEMLQWLCLAVIQISDDVEAIQRRSKG